MTLAVCEFCRELPPAPWIYCQKESCRAASIGRLVQETQAIRARRERAAEKADASPVLFKTQEQAKCPLCKARVSTGMCSSCSGCKTTYHNDCLLELTGSRCPTYGCGKFVAT